jgi:hypothetical protein
VPAAESYRAEEIDCEQEIRALVVVYSKLPDTLPNEVIFVNFSITSHINCATISGSTIFFPEA